MYKKKYTANDPFHGNGPYGKIPTKKEPIRALKTTEPYNNPELGIYSYFGFIPFLGGVNT